MKRMIRRNSGFTLVEILAVTILIAVLAGGAALGISANIKRGKQRSTTAQIATFGQAISLFEMECGSYPSSLEDLVHSPSSSKCKDYPKEGYLSKQEVPQDPWNNDFNYRKPGSHNTSSYDIWSNGPDGEEGTGDDITNWKSESSEE